MRLTKDEEAIVFHTLGLAGGGMKSYRNHFVAGPGHHDMPTLESLVKRGVMYRGNTPGFLGNSDAVFYVVESCISEAEKIVARRKKEEEAKLTRSQRRYRRYLASDDAFDSFRDFLLYEARAARLGGRA